MFSSVKSEMMRILCVNENLDHLPAAVSITNVFCCFFFCLMPSFLACISELVFLDSASPFWMYYKGFN